MAGVAGDQPTLLTERFDCRLPQGRAAELLPGATLVAAQLWPAQGLAKGSAALSPALRDALARPASGARLLVYPSSSLPGSSSSCDDGSSSSGLHCTEVYVRLCRSRAPAGVSSTAAATAALLLPDEADSGGGGSAEGSAPASPAAVQSPVMRGRSGASPAALSPAMRGGNAPPVALSPAMRAGGASPNVKQRGRAATPQSSGKGAAAGRPATPSVSSTSSGGRAAAVAAAAAARVRDRAKAEAVLATLLAEGGLLLLLRLCMALDEGRGSREDTGGCHRSSPAPCRKALQWTNFTPLPSSSTLHLCNSLVAQTPARARAAWWRRCCCARCVAAAC